MNLKSLLSILCFTFIFVSCSSTKTGSNKKSTAPTMKTSNSFLLTEISKDKTYGYTKKNPIKVGGVNDGPINERRYLNALSGPNGETVHYQRQRSCCAFKTKNGIMGSGLLDIYEIRYDGLEEPIILYINMYDYEELKAPVGFTIK